MDVGPGLFETGDKRTEIANLSGSPSSGEERGGEVVESESRVTGFQKEQVH